MTRYFNTAGPCDPDRHYMLPPERRLPEVGTLIERALYFVIHAPRQTGKTTIIRALANQLTGEGRYTALVSSCEVGQAVGGDLETGIQIILDSLRQAARSDLPEDLRPEFGVGSGRIDLCVRQPWSGGVQRWAVELKVWREGRPDPLPVGLTQLSQYLAKLGLDSGTLILFDARAGASALPERCSLSEVEHDGKRIQVLRL